VKELKNVAILKEIGLITSKISSLNSEISATCHQLSGKDEQGRWRFGIVSVSFPVKGNSKLIGLLKSNDYTVRRVKKAQIDYQYDGYVMWTIAEKHVELE